jgi:hypothetical protein
MRLLSSARMRRRLLWVSGFAGLAGLMVLLAVFVFPSSKPPPEAKISNKKADIVHIPKPHPFHQSEASAVLRTLRAFIATGVRGQHLSSAWQLMAPPLKTGFTKQKFMKGSELPYQIYPADPTRTRPPALSFSYANEVGIRVSLFPRPNSNTRPVVFDVVERKYGHGSDARWLVSSFTPAPSASGDFGSGKGATLASPGSGSGQNFKNPINHASTTWLLLPAGIFGGLLLGLAIFLTGRSLRNAALYRAYSRDHQRSSWRPS